MEGEPVPLFIHAATKKNLHAYSTLEDTIVVAKDIDQLSGNNWSCKSMSKAVDEQLQ